MDVHCTFVHIYRILYEYTNYLFVYFIYVFLYFWLHYLFYVHSQENRYFYLHASRILLGLEQDQVTRLKVMRLRGDRSDLASSHKLDQG